MPSILIRNRRWLKIGRKIVLATAGCIARCCGGCPLWRRIVRCDTGPTCEGVEPPFVEAWICDSVRCTNGSPLSPGVVFVLDGACWTVAIEQHPNPSGTRFTSKDPVECVVNCYDERCPQGVLWTLAQPCDPANPPLWICGVTVCGIYRAAINGQCYRVDPASIQVPGPALPPGAITSPTSAGPFATCCDCANECNQCPIISGTIEDEQCFPGIDFNRTCCRPDDACYRVDRIFGRQTFNPPAPAAEGGLLYSIVNEMVSSTIGPGGIQTATIRNTRLVGPFDMSPPSPIITETQVIVGGCGTCPTFSQIPPEKNLASSQFTDFVTGNYCGEQPGGITLIEFAYLLNCERQVFRVEWSADVGRIINTRFEIEVHIDNNDGGICAGRCNSGALVVIDPSALENQRGCKDCVRVSVRL